MTDRKASAPTRADPAKYNAIVSHATIRDIRLVGARFDLKPDAVEIADKIWSFQLSDQLDDWTCDNEKGSLTGLFSYTASCLEGRRKLLSVTCRYLSSYRLSDLCDEEASRLFLLRVGRFAAYPYFRSTFAGLTQQSGILLPPLPVISDGPRWINPPAEAEKAVAPPRRRKGQPEEDRTA